MWRWFKSSDYFVRLLWPCSCSYESQKKKHMRVLVWIHCLYEFWNILLSRFCMNEKIVLWPSYYKSLFFKISADIKFMPINLDLVPDFGDFVLPIRQVSVQGFVAIFREKSKNLARNSYKICSKVHVTTEFENNNNFPAFWCIIHEDLAHFSHV